MQTNLPIFFSKTPGQYKSDENESNLFFLFWRKRSIPPRMVTFSKQFVHQSIMRYLQSAENPTRARKQDLFSKKKKTNLKYNDTVIRQS